MERGREGMHGKVGCGDYESWEDGCGMVASQALSALSAFSALSAWVNEQKKSEQFEDSTIRK